MNFNENSTKKDSKVKRKIYKEYSYFSSSSTIPLRTKQHWAAKRKNCCESDDLCDTPVSTASPNWSLKEFSDNGVIHEIKISNVCIDSAPNCITVLNDNEETTNVNETAFQLNANLLEEHSLPVSQYLPLHFSTGPSCSTNIVDNRSYSIDDLIVTLTCLSIKLRHKLTYTEDLARGMSILNDSVVVKASKYHWKNIVNTFSDPVTIHHLCLDCSL